jgi:hypothetical protein
MRPYGMQRTPELEYPDVADIQRLGLKSSAGRYRKKGGDFRGYAHGEDRARTRRSQKRHARHEGRARVMEDLEL